MQRNYDHFWDNDFHLWDYYTQAWVAVAKKWAKQPYLMGYDLFNEPSAGTQTLTCANPLGCPLFEAKMQSLFDHVRTAIRKVDTHNIVWYEPQFFTNALSQSNFTQVQDPNVGLSWHDYACTPAFVDGGVIPGDPDCALNEPRVMNNAQRQAKTMNAASVLTEYGAGDDYEDLARMTNLADQHLVGWMYWAFKLWNDLTGGKNEGLFTDDSKLSSLKAAKADVLFRPYPQAIAGTPTAMSWNATGKVLSFTYQPNRATGLTDVFVPARTYAKGYVVNVTGGRVRTGAPAHHVFVDASPGAALVRVVVQSR